MPRRGGRHQVLVRGAEQAMEAFKLEIAADLGLAHLIDDAGSYKGMTTLQVGQIGGEMVRRIQAAGEYAIMQRYRAGDERLMPDDLLPRKEAVREVSNNGNPSPQTEFNHDTGTMTSHTGQQWTPNDNEMSDQVH